MQGLHEYVQHLHLDHMAGAGNAHLSRGARMHSIAAEPFGDRSHMEVVSWQRRSRPQISPNASRALDQRPTVCTLISCWMSAVLGSVVITCSIEDPVMRLSCMIHLKFLCLLALDMIAYVHV